MRCRDKCSQLKKTIVYQQAFQHTKDMNTKPNMQLAVDLTITRDKADREPEYNRIHSVLSSNGYSILLMDEGGSQIYVWIECNGTATVVEDGCIVMASVPHDYMIWFFVQTRGWLLESTIALLAII